MERFNKACCEILELLKYLPQEDYEKIPIKEIDFFEKNKDKKYLFKFDEKLSFEEQNIMPETLAILEKLYIDYFFTDEQKKEVYEIFKKCNNNEI